MLVFYSILLFIMLLLIESNIGRGIRLNCTAQCSFQMSFDDELQRPSKCLQRITSDRCVARVAIFYHIRQISVYFRTTGSESNEEDFTLYATQQVSHIFNSNHTSYMIIFACFSGDDCDWIYTRGVINRFTKINYTFIFHNFKLLLYNNSNKGVSQCYKQNKIIDCNHGVCSSLVSQENPHVNRSCVYLSDFNVGIDIRRYRIFSELAVESQNYISYLCNQNICNNPTTETAIKSMIQKHSSLFEILEPSKTNSIINNNNKSYLIFIVLLLYFI